MRLEAVTGLLAPLKFRQVFFPGRAGRVVGGLFELAEGLLAGAGRLLADEEVEFRASNRLKRYSAGAASRWTRSWRACFSRWSRTKSR